MAASGADFLYGGCGAPPSVAAFLFLFRSFLFSLFHFGRRGEKVADFEDIPHRGNWHPSRGGVAGLGRAETPFRWASTTLLPVVFFPCADVSVEFLVLQAFLLHADLLRGRRENVAGRLRTAFGRPFGCQGFRGICFAVRCEMHGVYGLGHLGSFYFLRSDVAARETGRGGASGLTSDAEAGGRGNKQDTAAL